MPQTIWSPEMLTGWAAMDDLHRNFCEVLSELSFLSDDEFRSSYPVFVVTAERAFAAEEQWMEEIEFPSLKSHREQHARVLGALHSTHSMVMDGNLATGRRIVEKLLPEWFFFHASTMNMVLGLALQLADSQNLPLPRALTPAYA